MNGNIGIMPAQESIDRIVARLEPTNGTDRGVDSVYALENGTVCVNCRNGFELDLEMHEGAWRAVVCDRYGEQFGEELEVPGFECDPDFYFAEMTEDDCIRFVETIAAMTYRNA